MKGAKTNYILNDHYFDHTNNTFTPLSLYLQLKSINNLFLKSILHTDGFDNKQTNRLMNYKYGTICQF
jgi:hypothetical protein